MPLDLATLPEDIKRYLAKDSEGADGTVPSEEVLRAIGISISKLRDEAKQARETSGIEDRWRDAEEAYAGIDDVNRGQLGSQWTKSMSLNGPIQEDSVPDDKDDRSTLFVLMTQRYVNAARAKLGEILLSPGAKSFGFSATPLPEQINAAKNDNRAFHMDQTPGLQPGDTPPLAMRNLRPGEVPPPTLMGSSALTPPPAIAAPVPPSGAPPVPAPAGGPVAPAGAAGAVPGQPPAQPQVPITVAEAAKDKISRANDAAKLAETRIYDWHVECNRSAHVRKVIFDSSRLGVGVLKGPFARPTRQMATRQGEDGNIELGIRKVTYPASKWVNAWNFYPDPTCGEDVQDGDYVFEREWAGERQVRKLRAMPGYIGSQIAKVLNEGPQKANVREGITQAPESDENSQLKKGKYEIWYFHGTLTRDEMGCICEAAGDSAKFAERVPPDRDKVYAVVTMINDSVVKATMNPLDSGDFPYHAMPWERRTGSWAGIGVAEQLATPQKIVNAAMRSMLDNAGISAGGQIVIDTSVITPSDGVMAMRPHKIWYLNGEGDKLNVNEAFGLFRVDNVTDQMLKIIEFGLRQAEESTSIPLVTQGQSGATTPDTLGATQIQDNNANQLLRSVGYQFDDSITEPETRQYYEWLILDPDVPNEEKGDWTIDAHGSSALVERAIQDQFLAQIGQLVLNPAYEMSPAKWAEMFVRSKRLEPKDLKYDEDELEKMKNQPAPAAPAIEVAKIRAQIDQAKIAASTQDAQADNARADKEVMTQATVELHTLQLKKELAMLEYAKDQRISLEQTKVDLAKTAMTIQAQKDMQARDHDIDMTKHRETQPQRQAPRRQRGNGKAPPQVATPAVEPPGRAQPGRAFEQ